MTDALAVQMPGFAGPVLPEWVQRQLRAGLGGVCLFGTNVESPEQLRALTDAIYAANPDAVIAIDEEGGDVSRLHHRDGSPYPGNAILGRLDDEALTRAVAARVGADLAAAGVGLDLAPDADVNANPLNPVIGVRSFGAEPDLVSRHTAAWTRGLQSAGVAACAKHFPGHGDTAQDSHVALPVVDVDAATLRARDLAPFAAAIAAGTRTVMTSHIVVPAIDAERPATFSPAVLEDLLRDELGFDGVIVTDALDMAGASAGTGIPTAAASAVEAGADLLCVGTDNSEAQVLDIAEALKGVDAERLAAAASRVRELGRELRAARATAPAPGAAPELPAANRVAEAFRVNDAAIDALAAARDAGAPVSWFELSSPRNIAVGDAAWGPFSVPGGPRCGAVVAGERDLAAALEAIPADAAVVAVGRDLARLAWVGPAVAALRAARTTVVVDMGWPATDPISDVDTYGATRLAGAALLTIGL